MKREDRKGPLSIIGSEKGITLIVSLMVVLLLLLQGLVFLTVSATESTISTNEVNTSQAFQLADAGIEHGRRELESLDLSEVLAETTSVFGGANTANLTVGSLTGNYTVTVENNYDGAGTLFPRGNIPEDSAAAACSPTETVDCDRIVVIRSTGDFQGRLRTIEAIIQVPLAAAPGAVYVMNGVDPDPTAEIEDFEPDEGSYITGNDCNPPSNVGGTPPGKNVPGIAVQGGIAYTNVTTDLGANLLFVTGKNGPGDVQIDPDTMSTQEFDGWVDSLLAAAIEVPNGPCGGDDPKEIGTWANPQICHIRSDTFDLNNLNGATGAGILIIDDLVPNDNDLDATFDNFTYEGIVIVLGHGRLRLVNDTRIYGAAFQRNYDNAHSGETRLRVRDTSGICYSSLAFRKVQVELKPIMMAWYEK